MNATIILVDTSVLVRLRDTRSPMHPVATAALRRLVRDGWELCTASQCIMEFWAVATRPADARGGLGLSVQQARADVAWFLQTHTLLAEPANILEHWLEVVEQYGVSGKQVWDARIAAIMRFHGVQHILTFNPEDFARYDFLRPLSPSEV